MVGALSIRACVTARLIAPFLALACTCLVSCAASPGAGRSDGRTASGAAGEAIRYTIDLGQPQTQTARVEMVIPSVRGRELDVALPVWRPGRYALNEHATTITEVRATDERGDALPVHKTDKATWRVGLGGARDVTVSYRVYANSLNDRTRHIDETHAFLSPSSVFMYVPERRSAPVLLKVDAPQGWRTATGLEPARAGATDEFAAPDYDVFADSPLEIGNHDLHEFEVDGVRHEVVVWHAGNAAGSAPVYDGADIKEDFAKIVRAESAIFGGLPYTRYVFLVHSGSGLSGGTEHLNSTIMQTSRATLEEPGAYRRFLSLAAHEFFHTWNVKRLRPAGLKPYDYAHENYTDLLWVAEGTTSYYTQICLVRAGLRSASGYVSGIGSMIGNEMNNPGWDEQSLEESSFDAWVKFNKSWPDKSNSTVSFYSKGELISLLLDMEIRARSEGRASLDTVMRAMFERFPLEGPGYTTADLIAVVNEAAGTDLSAFFERFVEGKERPDFNEFLRVVGLECTRKARSGETYLGLNLSDKDGRAVVTSVAVDGPAFGAGLIADDQVVALNGRSVRAGEVDSRIRSLKPGDAAVFTLLRRDELRTVSVTLAESPRSDWTVRKVSEPTDEQKAAYRSWLGTDW